MFGYINVEIKKLGGATYNQPCPPNWRFIQAGQP
jgi:hypothetical protein